MSKKDEELEIMLRSVRGFDPTNQVVQDIQDEKAVPKTTSKKEIISKALTATQVSDNSLASLKGLKEKETTNQTSNASKEQKTEKVEKGQEKKTGISNKAKSSKTLKTTIHINRKLLYLIKYHSGESANRFIEREIIKILMKEFTDAKADLESL